MKKNHLKISAVILCTLLALCSCNGETADTTAAETAPDTFTEVAYPNEPSPLTINGEQISYDEYRYYMNGIMRGYDGYNTEYWTNATEELKEKIKNETLETIRELRGMKALADSYNITVSDDQLKEIDDAIEQMRIYYGTDAEFYRYLDSMHLTMDVNRSIAYSYYLRGNLYNYMTSEESDKLINPTEERIRRFLNDYAVCADRIFISNDYGEDLNENETLINKIKEELDNGGSFKDLRIKYTEDENVSEGDKGIFFCRDTFDEYYFDEAMKLKEGEISGIISTHSGYMIIKRFSPDEEFIKENLEGSLADFYSQQMLVFAIQKETDKQSVSYSDSYDSITVLTVK